MARGEVHDGVGTVLDSEPQLRHFFVEVGGDGEVPMLALILTLATCPMAMGSSAPARWSDIGRNDQSARRHFGPHELDVQLLAAPQRVASPE